MRGGSASARPGWCCEDPGGVSLAGGHGPASARRPGTATPRKDTFQQPGCAENGVGLCSVILDLQCWRSNVGLFPLGSNAIRSHLRCL